MANKKKAAKKAPAVKKGPRQNALPGMEDREISVLQDAALRYAEVRDTRMGFSKQEIELKNQLLDLMHGHKKKHYQFANVLIDIVPEGEKIKVKIKKADDMTAGELGQGTEEDVEEEDEGEDVEVESSEEEDFI